MDCIFKKAAEFHAFRLTIRLLCNVTTPTVYLYLNNIPKMFSLSLLSRLNEPNWSGFQGGAPQLQWGTPSQYGTSSVNGGLIGSSNAGHSNPHSRVVVINRDDRGFGFVVAGDNPVFVQTVREGNDSWAIFVGSRCRPTISSLHRCARWYR